MDDEKMTKIVVTIPMRTYFQLKEKAGDLTVKQYVELLLRSVDRLSRTRNKSPFKTEEEILQGRQL